MPNFNGFNQETIKYFQELRENNGKSWFEKQRSVYEEYVLGPLRNLVDDLGPFMQMLDPQFDVRPQINRTISKIYRDTRFSKDKSMFRDHMWIVFRRHQGSLSDEICYFFEIRIDSFSYGMGFYSAPRELMINLKKRMLSNPGKFLKIVNNPVLNEHFELKGDVYSRLPVKEFPPDLENWIKFKSFHFGRKEQNISRTFSSDLIDDLKEGFLILYPIYCFIQNMKPNVKVNFQ
jgi:uncharacterized protein (TIGR02453 family)